MKVLITGTPRSGTTYIAQVLSNYGLDIPHESHIGQHGIVSWVMGGKPVSPPWGPKFRTKDYDIILHQVRHPLSCIKSYGTMSKITWKYIHRKCPGLSSINDICTKYLEFWIRWNNKIEEMCNHTYCVEEIGDCLDWILGRFGISDYDRQIFESVSRVTNSRQNRHLAEDCSNNSLVPKALDLYERYRNSMDSMS